MEIKIEFQATQFEFITLKHDTMTNTRGQTQTDSFVIYITTKEEACVKPKEKHLKHT